MINKKIRNVYLFGILFLIAGVLCSLFLGTKYFNIQNALRVFTGNGNAADSLIFFKIRLPRTVLGVMVGIELSLSGLILQGVLRNKLASPSIVGISSGASFFAVLILILQPHLFGLVPLGAFCGGIMASVFVYLFAYKNGVSTVNLILSGVAVNTLFSAGTTLLMNLYSDRVQGALSFMAGSMSATTWKDVKSIIGYFVISIVLIFLFAPKINLLLLGDETAKSIGVHVEALKIVLILIAVLMASSAVSVVGTIGFVGLIVPNMLSLLVGDDYKRLVPLSVLYGGGLLSLCDALGRSLLSPLEIPVGIIMAILGVPFFLFILRRKSP